MCRTVIICVNTGMNYLLRMKRLLSSLLQITLQIDLFLLLCFRRESSFRIVMISIDSVTRTFLEKSKVLSVQHRIRKSRLRAIRNKF